MRRWIRSAAHATLDDGVAAFVLLKLALQFLPKDLYDSFKVKLDKRSAVDV